MQPVYTLENLEPIVAPKAVVRDTATSWPTITDTPKPSPTHTEKPIPTPNRNQRSWKMIELGSTRF
ncbi:MAG: hypothetical protein KatS3mg101_0511 [Patescibacteria group bacterium]|nr:MAG: hypothetical protein KatS3mg101_0511 [Patescibacteria group bacterium]